MTELQHKGKFSNISDIGAQHENKRNDNASGSSENERGLGKDYWESVADDSGAGYKDVRQTDPLLIEDQLADDPSAETLILKPEIHPANRITFDAHGFILRKGPNNWGMEMKCYV